MPKIDARMISLFSRDARRDPFPKHLEEETAGYSFSFYDAIDVKKVEIEEGPVHKALLDTYEKSQDPGGGSGFTYRQVLFAFRDLTDGEANGESPQSIDRFWDDSEEPLLFVSMINVKTAGIIQETLEKIETIFGTEHCRPYLTFDHCDIIIFFKGKGFSDFVDNIFDLNYGHNLVEDTITLFTFLNEKRFPREKYATISGEVFDVNIRVGVRSFPGFETFKEKVCALDKKDGGPDPDNSMLPAAFHRLLGRNDVAVCKRNATMAWLAKMKDLVDQEPVWYTTYDMEVLVSCGKKSYASSTAGGSLPEEPTESPLDREMEHRFQKFKETYEDKCREMNTATDEVFLRWLKRASGLSVSFFENQLSADLGTCLVPQFFDILEYGRRFFASEKTELGHMDGVRKVFQEFFSNISILTDSLNHSNRQFIQFPSYNSISFEMPPKIMAYFSVLAKDLVDVFQDKEELLYGVTISPKFACELDVSSCAIRQVLERDELIAISIEESWLYSLLRTTEAMAHEISHFVGERNRCRVRRREFFVKCAVAELLDGLVFDIQERLAAACDLSPEELPPEKYLTMDWASAQALVDRLWGLLNRLDGGGETPAPERDLYRVEVYWECLNLSRMIDSHPTLRYELFQWLRENLAVEGPLLKRMIQKNAGKLGLPELEGEESWAPGGMEQLKGNGLWEYCRNFAGDEIYRVMRRLLKDDAGKNKALKSLPYVPLFLGAANPENYNIVAHIFYMFGETFADLQSILLFDMNMEDYYQLLLKDQRDTSYDALPRMIAVARALLCKGYWDEEKTTLGEDGEAARILQKGAWMEEDRIVDLQEDNISPNLVYYLTGYLSECVDAVQETLEKHATLRDQLRDIHGSLKTEDSISGLNGKMLAFIEEYRGRLSGG